MSEKLSPERLAEIAARIDRALPGTAGYISGPGNDPRIILGTDVPALLSHIAAVEADLQFAKDEWAGLQEAHERLKASYVANPEHWRSRCEVLDAEVERLRKGAMQHAKDWMESAAEALAQENENTALRAERDALAAKIARVEALRPSHLTPFDSSERSWWVRDDRLRAALRDEEAPK